MTDALGRPRVRFDQRATMRDGVTLSADVFLPSTGDGPWPALLNRTPYDNIRHPEIATYFAAHGYAVVVQDVRGRGDSDGEFDSWRQEAADGYDTVEWVADQQWCSGAVVGYGGSYQSYCGWAAARERPPHLRALISRATSGIASLGVPHDLGAASPYWLWYFNLTAGRTLQAPLDGESPALDWDRVLRSRPLAEMDVALGRSLPAWREFLATQSGDAPIAAYDLDEVFTDLDLPVLHVTGWNDGAKWGELRAWQRMNDGPKRRLQQLVIGPWDHYGTGTPNRTTMGVDFGEAAAVDLKARMLEFLRCALDDGLESGHERVEYFVTGRNEWRSATSWPPADLAEVTFFLDSDGGANSVAGDGRLSAEPTGPADEFTHDPANPHLSTEDLGTAFSAPRSLDDDRILARDDALVYTSAPLERELEIVGRPVVHLYAESDRVDTDFHVTLFTVDGTGTSRVVSRGWVRASYTRGAEFPRQLLERGQVHEYRVTLGDTAHRFAVGDRVRLTVASSNYPDVDVNPGTGAPLGADTTYVVARNTIHHHADRPSRLVLAACPAGEQRRKE